ncbi:protein yippee-like 2 isoform X3 [Cervus canadensis]|uniref:protein yippee-like 2 isoform X3 n=1 Tax=Cervus canadensis TaxID=1574408 RepID=UPI001C9E5842|nr:protein yippee-like 2 isoform X3 [Cervus canadensis]
MNLFPSRALSLGSRRWKQNPIPMFCWSASTLEVSGMSFQGSQGRAYLFNSVVNVGCGPAEERVLLTGLHAVADIYCENCKTTLGWKYVKAIWLLELRGQACGDLGENSCQRQRACDGSSP